MKNLMTYINPSECFGEEEKITIKIQIDNSLNLGWKREDIMLFTNFPYEYSGIKAIEVSGNHYRPYFPQATKISVIIELIKKGFVKKGELYWFHDLDVFQNSPITEAELDLEYFDMGLCDKDRMPRWDTGSIFFKESSKDIFDWTMVITDKFKINEEFALMSLTANNILWAAESSHEEEIGERVIPIHIPGIENIHKRVKKLNISYDFTGWNIRSTYQMAVKPIRAMHFHPLGTDIYGDVSALEFFMAGKNKIGVTFASDRLVKIFDKHGISI